MLTPLTAVDCATLAAWPPLAAWLDAYDVPETAADIAFDAPAPPDVASLEA